MLSRNHIFILIFVGLFCFLGESAYAFTKSDSSTVKPTDTNTVKTAGEDSVKAIKKMEYSFTFEFGAGVTDKFREEMLKSPKDNLAFSGRILLKPNRRLNVGIHSAYFWLKKESQKDVESEFNKTNLKASLSAIPIIFVFNMRIMGIDFCSGLGTSRLISMVNAFNEKVVAGTWNYCFYASVGYNLYLSSRWGIGLEADYYTFSSIKADAVGGRVKFVYDLRKW